MRDTSLQIKMVMLAKNSFKVKYSDSFLPFSGRRPKMSHKSWCAVKPQHNQFTEKNNFEMMCHTCRWIVSRKENTISRKWKPDLQHGHQHVWIPHITDPGEWMSLDISPVKILILIGIQGQGITLFACWPRRLSWMRVRLETRRSWVRPQPRSATFFRGDWSWNTFYGHSLPSADSRRAVVSFWRKNVHNTG